MDVKERIKKVEQYFRGMQVQNVEGQNIIYVIVQFPPKWIVDDEIPNKFGVSIAQGNDYQGQYYFCAEMEKGFDTVFDAVEYNITKMLTAQERANLLRQKVQELQELFMNESVNIEALRTLEFTYKTPKTRKKNEKKNAPQEVEQTEIEETNLEQDE